MVERSEVQVLQRNWREREKERKRKKKRKEEGVEGAEKRKGRRERF